MSDVAEVIRTRLLPAVLTAAGVTFLAAGLLSYTTPAEAGPGTSPTPSPTDPAAATPTPLITLPPLGSALPSVHPSAPPDRVATRVRIAALDIDLPVVKPPADSNDYPLCDVAMWFGDMDRPGDGRATYLYAHAREGMFLPLLRTPGSKQRGLVVEVWTSDDMRFLYEITQVRRDQRDLNDALAARTEQLWLQTSEGPKGTPGKTQVIAKPISVEASSYAAAHPKPHPLVCG
jgi:Sortase domain